MTHNMPPFVRFLLFSLRNKEKENENKTDVHKVASCISSFKKSISSWYYYILQNVFMIDKKCLFFLVDGIFSVTGGEDMK